MKLTKYLLAALIFTLLMISCNNDCEEGFTGDDCDIEIRTQHIGVYEGDMTSCVPGDVALLLPDDITNLLSKVSLVVSPDPSNVNLLTANVSSSLFNYDIIIDTRQQIFTIAEFTEMVSISITTLELTGSGTGELIDANNIDLSMAFKFSIGLGLTETCKVNFQRI